MVYITTWLDFLTQSKQLYIERPQQTRYTVKYRHADAEIVLKVTDDKKCLQFRSHLQSDLKYVEKINRAFMKLMTAKQPDTVDLSEELSDEKKPEKRSSPASPINSSSTKKGNKSTKRSA